jgi:8-oxo-dGTP pyrophosphatase MutT (NUDIX family)/phosphohistidine phosphatase SixA
MAEGLEARPARREGAPRVTLVRAAGGLITREGPDGTEVVVVHRPAYDDWSFPKGKLESGEDEIVAALREVEEETRLVCAPRDDLGAITYVDGRGRPKIVRYWRMETDDPARLHGAHEVDEARWVPVAIAEPLLSYPHDRTLLRRLAGDPVDGVPVPVHVIRHAKAGDRSAWGEPDELRPISKTGRRQSARLAERLARVGVTRLVSSPFLRCIQTLEPLAEELDLDIDVVAELGEGQPAAGAEAWALAAAADGPAAMCTHGDVLVGLIERLRVQRVPTGETADAGYAKAGAWRLDVLDGRVHRATYLPPPET